MRPRTYVRVRRGSSGRAGQARIRGTKARAGRAADFNLRRGRISYRPVAVKPYLAASSAGGRAAAPTTCGVVRSDSIALSAIYACSQPSAETDVNEGCTAVLLFSVIDQTQVVDGPMRTPYGW